MKKLTTSLIFGILLFLLSNASNSDTKSVLEICPNLDFKSTLRVFGDLCYQFVPNEMYWTDAEDFCQKKGGRLVKVPNATVNNFIVRSLNEIKEWTNNGVWIGLSDLENEGTWVWTNKPKEAELLGSWSYWGYGHPGAIGSSFRDCIRMVRGYGDWKWHETPCYSLLWKYRFICQYQALSIATTKEPKPLKNPELPYVNSAMKYGELKSAPASTPPEKNTSQVHTIVLLCLLLLLLVVFIVVLLKFGRLQRKQRLLMMKVFSQKELPPIDLEIPEEYKKYRSENVYIDEVSQIKLKQLYDDGRKMADKMANLENADNEERADKKRVENIYEKLPFKEPAGEKF